MSEVPSWSENPFGGGNESTENVAPFSDPSVTEVSSTMPEYDPYSGNEEQAPDWAQKAPSPQPVQVAEAPKPVQTHEDKARETAYAENQQQAENQQAMDPYYRPANWPPFPKSCCWPFRPCFHHNFKGEIPDWGYSAVKITYMMWMAYAGCLLWNMICMFTALGLSDANVTSAGLGVAYFVIFIPLAYCCWFQSLYQAMRKDSSLRFGWFFFTFFFQLISCSIFAVGVPGWGGSGVWVSIGALNDNTIIGIIMFTSAGSWIVMAMLNSYIIKVVLALYRSTGQSFEKAQREAAAGAAPHVANAVIASATQK